MANDADVDNDDLKVVAISTPAHGTANLNLNGSVRYRPNANYCGSDSFTYTVSDGHNGSAAASVNEALTA